MKGIEWKKNKLEGYFRPRSKVESKLNSKDNTIMYRLNFIR